MAKTKVDYLKIGNSPDFGEFGTVYTKNGDHYFLWWTEAWPEATTGVHRIRYDRWVSLIREAITNDLEVEFLTESNYSSKVLTINLFSP